MLCREGLPQDSLVGSLASAMLFFRRARGHLISTKFLIHQGTANVTVQEQRASDSAQGMALIAEALGSLSASHASLRCPS